VTSSLPSRLSWVASEAGRPLPDFCEDDVMNFLVTEAVVEKAALERADEQEKARDRAKRDAWRKQHRELTTPLGVG
jgi:hypothetical protein